VICILGLWYCVLPYDVLDFNDGDMIYSAGFLAAGGNMHWAHLFNNVSALDSL